MVEPLGTETAVRIRRFAAALLPLLTVVAGARPAAARDQPTVTVTMSANPENYRGACAAPVRITLTGKILVVGAVKDVTAQFRFGDGTPVGPVRVAELVSAGVYAVRDTFVRSRTWTDSLKLFVRAPVPAVSPKVIVTVTCDAPLRPVEPARPRTPPAQVGEGSFRVTATGFTVLHQTTESPIETYGAGDEVKLVSWGAEYTLGGGARALPIVRTLTYGDIDGTHDFSRVQAGRGNGRSNGGLMTGDSVPTAGAPTRRLSPEDARSHVFPVVLWEGVLRDGVTAPSNMVVLLPTLWEMDGVPDADLMPLFGPWASAFVEGYGRTTMNEAVAWGGTSWGPLPLVGNGMYANRWHDRVSYFGDYSRPIGLNGGYATAPGERREWGPDPWGVHFVPRPLRLTFGSASAAAAVGGVQLTFTDEASFGGSYSLAVRIEAVR